MLARAARFFPEAPSEALRGTPKGNHSHFDYGWPGGVPGPYGPGRPIVKMTMEGLVACLAPYEWLLGMPGPL